MVKLGAEHSEEILGGYDHEVVSDLATDAFTFVAAIDVIMAHVPAADRAMLQNVRPQRAVHECLTHWIEQVACPMYPAAEPNDWPDVIVDGLPDRPQASQG